MREQIIIMTTNNIISKSYDQSNKTFNLYLNGATCLLLRHLLSLDMQYIFVKDYLPNEQLEWWNCPVLFNEKGNMCNVEVKSLVFDFQLPTDTFLNNLHEFENSGIELYQCKNKLPATLYIDKLLERNKYKVFQRIGISSCFYLPHSYELAHYWTFDECHFSKIVNCKEIMRLSINKE